MFRVGFYCSAGRVFLHLANRAPLRRFLQAKDRRFLRVRQLRVDRVLRVFRYRNFLNRQRRPFNCQVGVLGRIYIKIQGFFLTLNYSIAGRVRQVFLRVFNVQVFIGGVYSSNALRLRDAIVRNHVCFRAANVGRQTGRDVFQRIIHGRCQRARRLRYKRSCRQGIPPMASAFHR